VRVRQIHAARGIAGHAFGVFSGRQDMVEAALVLAEARGRAHGRWIGSILLARPDAAVVARVGAGRWGFSSTGDPLMEEARVIGTVVSTQRVAALRGRKLVWIAPLDASGAPDGAPLVAVDVTQSGPGSRVIFVRSREAAEALEDPFCPVDAAVLGIVDESVCAPRGQATDRNARA